ncbi:hypothetical protein [Patiriisocius sp. Uisw_017]|uniref:hypothetical protein n=1 Tax=Patiriisocius sp. Uisw_017 TaxID=3230968 RepID=UPI0039E78411
MKKNPFKEISTDKELPSEVKKSVMGKITSIGLLSELADLFIVKFASVFKGVFTEKKKRQ